MRPAVELSYLNEDCQRDLVDEIDLNDCTPSHDQAIRMRKFFEEGKLTLEDVVAYAKQNGEPKQVSGKQELYEAIVNMYC